MRTGYEIPPTASMRPRPIMYRLALRNIGVEPGPPTEDEKRDAIRILEQGGYPDGLLIEAERLLAEWGDRGGSDIRAHA